MEAYFSQCDDRILFFFFFPITLAEMASILRNSDAKIQDTKLRSEHSVQKGKAIKLEWNQCDI